MEFLGQKAKKPFWHARSEFTFLTRTMYADDVKTGAQFANETIERLRTDGLLKACKTPSPPVQQ